MEDWNEPFTYREKYTIANEIIERYKNGIVHEVVSSTPRMMYCLDCGHLLIGDEHEHDWDVPHPSTGLRRAFTSYSCSYICEYALEDGVKTLFDRHDVSDDEAVYWGKWIMSIYENKERNLAIDSKLNNDLRNGLVTIRNNNG